MFSFLNIFGPGRLNPLTPFILRAIFPLLKVPAGDSNTERGLT